MDVWKLKEWFGIGAGTSGSGSGVIVVKWGFVVVFQGLSLS